jgi:dUTP pyrophosphatase
MQQQLKIKIKKLHEKSVIPYYSKSGDAGMDITAISRVFDEHGNVSYGTGLSFEIPEGYVGLLLPRSSNCKQDLLLSNSLGILDSGYRGEVFFKFKPSAIFSDDEFGENKDSDDFDEIVLPNGNFDDHRYYNIGDRIGQLMIIPYPHIEFEEVVNLSISERGEGGFGSTNTSVTSNSYKNHFNIID